MAGLCLTCSLFALVLVPKKTSSQSAVTTTPQTNSFNFSILRDSSFLLVSLGTWLC
jgi:hypothetical protein